MFGKSKSFTISSPIPTAIPTINDPSTLSEADLDRLIKDLAAEDVALTKELQSSTSTLTSTLTHLSTLQTHLNTLTSTLYTLHHTRNTLLTTLLTTSTQLNSLNQTHEKLSITPTLPSLININTNGSHALINNLPFHPPTNPNNKEGWISFSSSLGLSLLLLRLTHTHGGLNFNGARIVWRMGWSRIVVEGTGQSYNLFTDGGFSLFGSSTVRNFQRGIVAFVRMIGEAGRWVVDHDRTMSLPYCIEVDEKGEKAKVEGVEVKVQGGKGEEGVNVWKMLATDLIWIMAAVGKYGS